MFWRRKRLKPWRSTYDPRWYTSLELDQFLEWLDRQISRRAQPVHELIAQQARVLNERARRRSNLNA
jgi:hypothetical protein